MSIPIYLAVSPEEMQRKKAETNLNIHYAYLGYQLDESAPVLLSPQLRQREDSLMILQDSILPQYHSTEALAHCIANYASDMHTGLVCDFDRPVHPFFQKLVGYLDAICSQMSCPLWVPETYADFASNALVMIPSSRISGSFVEFANKAAIRYPDRAVLELCPISQKISLPFNNHCITVLSPQDREQLQRSCNAASFTSSELLCSYFSVQADRILSIVLYDTIRSLEEKISCAEHAGFHAIIGLQQELHCIFAETTQE